MLTVIITQQVKPHIHLIQQCRYTDLRFSLLIPIISRMKITRHLLGNYFRDKNKLDHTWTQRIDLDYTAGE